MNSSTQQKDLSPAGLCDAFPDSVHVLGLDLHPMSATPRVFGRIKIVKVSGGCLGLKNHLQTISRSVGDDGKHRTSPFVLIVDTPEDFSQTFISTPILDLIANRYRGLVVLGCVRRIGALQKMDFPIFAADKSPRLAPLNTGNCISGPQVKKDERVMSENDYISLDQDGAVIISQQVLEKHSWIPRSPR